MAKKLPDEELIMDTGIYNVVCPICGDTHEAPAIMGDRTEWYRGRLITANAVCSKPECRKHVSYDPFP